MKKTFDEWYRENEYVIHPPTGVDYHPMRYYYALAAWTYQENRLSTPPLPQAMKPSPVQDPITWKELGVSTPHQSSPEEGVKEEYSFERHGNGFALYLGRSMTRHGYNIANMTQVDEVRMKEIIDILNSRTPISQSKEDPAKSATDREEKYSMAHHFCKDHLENQEWCQEGCPVCAAGRENRDSVQYQNAYREERKRREEAESLYKLADSGRKYCIGEIQILESKLSSVTQENERLAKEVKSLHWFSHAGKLMKECAEKDCEIQSLKLQLSKALEALKSISKNSMPKDWMVSYAKETLASISSKEENK